MFKRIIAADDQEHILKLYQVVCQRYFPAYQLALASDGKQALQLIEMAVPDLLLLDLYMPYYPGLTVAQYFREDYPNAVTPIVFIGGSLTQLTAELKAIPNSFYLPKPFDLKDFVGLLTQLLTPVSLAEPLVWTILLTILSSQVAANPGDEALLSAYDWLANQRQLRSERRR